jgi:drug/metabolite transporter (DMT)-like permease
VFIAALVLISWDGLLHPIQAGFWVGDAMFALTALQWAGFSLLLKTWRLDPVRVTALVSVLGLAVVLPAYIIFIGPTHLATLPMKALSIQAIVQGVINGLLLVFAFGKAVQNLDVSRAALFPAAVPALAIIIGIPVAGDVPTALQLAGLFLATIGLVLASRKAARS